MTVHVMAAFLCFTDNFLHFWSQDVHKSFLAIILFQVDLTFNSPKNVVLKFTLLFKISFPFYLWSMAFLLLRLMKALDLVNPRFGWQYVYLLVRVCCVRCCERMRLQDHCISKWRCHSWNRFFSWFGYEIKLKLIVLFETISIIQCNRMCFCLKIK